MALWGDELGQSDEEGGWLGVSVELEDWIGRIGWNENEFTILEGERTGVRLLVFVCTFF